MKEKIGVALIGAGAIASVHADAYLQFSDLCEIRAVSALTMQEAERLIENKSLKNAVAYTGNEEIFGNPHIDAVSICTPPNTHCNTTVDALKAGKHVLVEKPMAVSPEECEAMIRAAKESGKVLSPVAQNRFKTPYAKMKQLVESGIAGEIKHAVINSLWWRGENYYDLWWRGTWESESGGCIINHAVHHLDLMIWMLGMPQRVTSVIKNVAHSNSQCEDLGIAIFEYDNMLAQMTASLVTHDEEQEIVLQAEKGRLSSPWKTASSKALPNGFPEENAEGRDVLQKAYDELPPLSLEGHPAQIRNFLDVISGNDSLKISSEDGKNVIELIMAIYKSAQLHEPVSLPIAPEDAFFRHDTMIAAMPHFFEKTKSIDAFETNEITLGRDVGK